MEIINTAAERFCGKKYFLEKFCPIDFDYRNGTKDCSPYFKSQGFIVPQFYSDFFSLLSGITSDRYLSVDMYFFYVLPALNRLEFLPAYMDKNRFEAFLPRIRQPRCVVRNANGIFYGVDGEVISMREAVSYCLDCACDCIIKPAVETGEGEGVDLLDQSSAEVIQKQFEQRGKDFLVQKRERQHTEMDRLNSGSFNTMRIFSYRDVRGEYHILKTMLRIGPKGSVRDNLGSGGGMVRVYEDGMLADRLIRYKSMQVDSLRRVYGIEKFRVPSYDRACDLVIRAHKCLPYFDIIGWDVGIAVDGDPVLIEYNINANMGGVQASGGPLLGDFTDEIMEIVRSGFHREKRIFSINHFSNGHFHQLQIG